MVDWGPRLQLSGAQQQSVGEFCFRRFSLPHCNFGEDGSAGLKIVDMEHMSFDSENILQ
jgi:hypothetical protein